MKLSTLFTLNAIVALIVGLAFLLVPTTMTSFYGGTLSDAGVYVARLYGGLVLGFAILSWLVRNATESETLKSIVLSFFITWALGFVVVIYFQITGGANVLGWLNVVIFLLFTVDFGYFQFVKK